MLLKTYCLEEAVCIVLVIFFIVNLLMGNFPQMHFEFTVDSVLIIGVNLNYNAFPFPLLPFLYLCLSSYRHYLISALLYR